MPTEKKRKRHAGQQDDGPPASPHTSLVHRPAGEHHLDFGSGSNSAYMGSVPTTVYNYIMELFEQFRREYRDAYVVFRDEVLKEKDKYRSQTHKISTDHVLALQEIVDKAKPEEAQQEKEAKLKEISREKLEAIEQKFNQAVQNAGRLVTTEKQASAIRKARNVKNSGNNRARKEARLALVDLAEVNAIAFDHKGDEINRKFNQMFQNAREGLNNGVSEIESTFINKIKDLIGHQEWLSKMMDAENLGNKDLVRLDWEDARVSGNVHKTQNAKQITEHL